MTSWSSVGAAPRLQRGQGQRSAPAMPDNPEAVGERVESPGTPVDDAWNDIQDSASVDPDLGRRYTILYVAEHGGRTYHDYSEYLRTEERESLIEEIAGSLGPRGTAYKDAIAKALEELTGGNAGI